MQTSLFYEEYSVHINYFPDILKYLPLFVNDSHFYIELIMIAIIILW